MSFIYLAPGSGVESEVLDLVEGCVSDTFGFPIRRLDVFEEPDYAYHPERDQYSSTEVLRMLVEKLPANAIRLLGLTEKDTFIPMLSFVFGQAQLGGRVALVSLARLRQEFYGLPKNPELLYERVCKEGLHEMGHTFGLTHCLDRTCVMSLSTVIQQVDSKGTEFCPSCWKTLREGASVLGRTLMDRGDMEEGK